MPSNDRAGFRVSAAVTVEYEEQIGPRERWVGVLTELTATRVALW